MHPAAPVGIGHPTAIDPAGRRLLELGSEPDLAVINLDLADTVREVPPVLRTWPGGRLRGIGSAQQDLLQLEQRRLGFRGIAARIAGLFLLPGGVGNCQAVPGRVGAHRLLFLAECLLR